MLGSTKVSKRQELNLKVSEASENSIDEFMTALGYPMCFQIKKERTVYDNGKVQVTFDEWPIIGCMLEIEGKEIEINQLAKQIAPDYEFGNFRLKEIFAKKIEETGKSFETLKLEYEKKYRL